jgi:hypothetical protein
MPKKRTEARLLSYTLIYDTAGKLITERTVTDISSLKTFLSSEEFTTLQTALKEATVKLDTIHNQIESHLNARLMNS